MCATHNYVGYIRRKRNNFSDWRWILGFYFKMSKMHKNVVGYIPTYLYTIDLKTLFYFFIITTIFLFFL